MKEAELARLANLRSEWRTYRRMLSEATVRLAKAKADFKDDLLSSLTDFNASIATMRSDFLRNAPFQPDLTSARAHELIGEYPY